MRLPATLAFVLVMAACRDEPEETSWAVPDYHPPDVAEPRETWKDRKSGMQFTTPGLGWTRLEGPELATLGPVVRLAVRQGARCTGWVSVEPASGRRPQAVAEAMRAAVVMEELAVHVDEDVKYDLWTARRYEVAGRVDGRAAAERTTVWRDADAIYAVVARTSERDYGSRRRCLDQITAGFSLGMAAP